MFCPNCGAQNNEKQNYCRFCGLNIQTTAKSLQEQINFGENSKSLKKLSKLKKSADVVSTALVGLLIVGFIADIFFIIEVSKEFLIAIIAVFLVIQVIQFAFSYLQSNEKNTVNTIGYAPDEKKIFESVETGKMLEERNFKPVPSVTENTTELLTSEAKTQNLEKHVE
jgi:uncharacterized membrane protein YvbJ